MPTSPKKFFTYLNKNSRNTALTQRSVLKNRQPWSAENSDNENTNPTLQVPQRIVPLSAAQTHHRDVSKSFSNSCNLKLSTT